MKEFFRDKTNAVLVVACIAALLFIANKVGFSQLMQNDAAVSQQVDKQVQFEKLAAQLDAATEPMAQTVKQEAQPSVSLNDSAQTKKHNSLNEYVEETSQREKEADSLELFRRETEESRLPEEPMQALPQSAIASPEATQVAQAKPVIKKHIWYVDINKGAGYDSDKFDEVIKMAESGDSIHIRRGKYKEKFDLMGKSVQIIGDDRDGVVLEGTQGMAAIQSNKGKLTLKNLTLSYAGSSIGASLIHAYQTELIAENLKLIKGSGSQLVYSINLVKADNSRLEKITSVDVPGIMISDSQRVSLNDCNLEQMPVHGIAIFKSSANIRNCKLSQVKSAAIHAFGGAKITVEQTSIQGSVTGLDASNSEASLAGFRCHSCSYGINISNMEKFNLRDSQFENIYNSAIAMHKTPFTIQNITVNSARTGFFTGTSYGELSNSNISNVDDGVVVLDPHSSKQEIRFNGITMNQVRKRDWSVNENSIVSGSNNSPAVVRRGSPKN